MKSLVAKLTLVALVATPLVSQAQHLIAQNDRMGQLTLLPGPNFLSPANATGEVVPGQVWTLKKTGTLNTNANNAPSIGSARLFTVGTLGASGGFPRQLSSSTLTISGGTLTFRPANGEPRENENFGRRLKSAPKPVDPESLRFDSKLPQPEIRPLQKAPASAAPNIKSL